MPLTRDEMTALFQIGVRAADPRAAVRDSLLAQPLPPCKRVFLLAFGKAACAMAEAALPLVPNPAAALVVTNPENAMAVQGAEVIAAGHPVPDAQSLRAGHAAEALLAQAGPDDRVLVLVSGGGSALLVAPVAGLTLADKAQVSQILLGAGLDIVAMNAVRQHLSRLKGGGVLRAAAPAPVTALILSDVIGDDLRAIASGPTVAPIPAREDLVADLQNPGCWERFQTPFPEAV
ncbi:MAG: glycerate-2-kinase family protein, partial [Roseinatronobacter sp.]|nr:glycerate-2-kinase family protein [Roseinatronobacter sp.]